MLSHIFNFLIFPGFLFTASLGLIVSWIDRKLTARLQWRKGPPFFQPLIDLIKLSIKEVIIPKDASRIIFFLSPLIGLSASIVVSTLLWLSHSQFGLRGFTGDIIVMVYLLMIPSVAVILGASASANPLASLGASREIKLILAYELPFIISLLVPIIKTGGLLRLGEIIMHQSVNGPIINSPSGMIAFIVSIICMQAKLGFVPFDIAEAETEIMGGTFIEYSGILLGVIKLTKMIMMVILPLFLIAIFWEGFNIWKYLLILVIIILIKNTNPRLRVDQAIRFFWGRMTVFAILAILLVIIGR